jgi:hypothetical protein
MPRTVSPTSPAPMLDRLPTHGDNAPVSFLPTAAARIPVLDAGAR